MTFMAEPGARPGPTDPLLEIYLERRSNLVRYFAAVSFTLFTNSVYFVPNVCVAVASVACAPLGDNVTPVMFNGPAAELIW